MQSLIIEHLPEQHRFETLVEGHTSEIDYTLADKVMTILHTGVPEQLSGKGIAAALTRHALETARAEGWKVIPVCSYAQSFIERHPEYQDLLAV